MKRALPYFLVALLTLSGAAAMGVSPPRAQITFEPGAQGAFDILLKNHKPFTVTTSVEKRGDLKEHFEIETPEIGARGAARAEIKYSLPEKISPGEHSQMFVFREEFFDPDEGSVAVRTAVGFRVTVWKPYPGRYVELDVNPRHVKEGRNTEVEVVLHSRGEQAVKGDLEIHVYSPDEKLLDTRIQEDIDVDGDSSRKRYAQILSSEYDPGKYTVKARYDYGDAVAEETAELIVGTKTLLIENVTRDFYKDTRINPFDVTVESMWNEPLDGVSASFKLGKQEGRTPTVTLSAFSKKELKGYWETDQSLPAGDHNALVTASFEGGEPVQATFPVRVHNESPQPQQQRPERIITLGVTDVAFFVVLLALIAYFGVHAYKRHKGHHNP